MTIVDNNGARVFIKDQLEALVGLSKLIKAFFRKTVAIMKPDDGEKSVSVHVREL